MEISSHSSREHKLGRKHIKSFAGGIAHMFACSAEHYAWQAYQYRMPVVTIDLLSLRIDPSEFDIERNRTLAGMCRRALLSNIESLKPPSTVEAAVLKAKFGIDDFRGDGRVAMIGESIFTVILTDDRGKEWRVEHKEERMFVVA